MKTHFTLILITLSTVAFAQTPKTVKSKNDSISAAIKKEKRELDSIRVVQEQQSKERLEKEKEAKKQEVLSDKSISLDRAELQKELDQIVQPVFRPGKIEVLSSSVSTSEGSKEAIKLAIPEADMDRVKKDWLKTLKRASKDDVKEKGNALSVSNASLKSISNEPLGVELSFDEIQGTVYMSTVLYKDSALVTKNEYPQLYTSTKSYLKEYGTENYQSKVKNDIREEEKVLKDLKKELDKLIKKNEKEHKEISDNQLLIDGAEDELKLNDGERKQALDNIQTKRNNVRKAKDKDAIKAAKKEVKVAQNEKKSLEKKRQKTYRSIVSYKSDIERANQAIDLNLQRQKEQTLSIYKQELKIKALEEKLAQIK